MLYDAHNHLQDAQLAPHRSQILADLAALPLRAAVVNGTCEADWPEVTALCAPNDQRSTLHSSSRHGAAGAAVDQLKFLPSYGLHPWHVGNAGPHWRDTLRRTLDATPHAAIGEIGLDRWILHRARPDDARLAGLRRAPFVEQQEAFTWQLALAAERNLPVTIHGLDAWSPLLEVLRATPRPARGFLLHAYSGSAELAREFAALGAYFSFNGSFLSSTQCHVIRDNSPPLTQGPTNPCHVIRDITRGAQQREVFRRLPLDRLLAETDAPAMPPPPEHRAYSLPGLAGDPILNHPANIGAIYAGLATLRGLDLAVLPRQVEENFHRLFSKSCDAC